MEQKVLLGFSAGIDSTACVDILKSEGYAVTALHIDVLGDKAALSRVKQKARELDLPLVIEDRVQEFKNEIIDYFTLSYLSGRTPAPCTLCNTLIKWATLESVADRLGIEKIATGHYFGIEQINEKYYVKKGVDSVKDQSYYLWNIPQRLMGRILTPMYDKIKAEIRPSGARESMGVCFLRGESYVELLKRTAPEKITQGDIVNSCGEKIGVHEGFPLYTIGQKRGLNISDKSKKYCITNIDAVANTLTVGLDDDLFYSNLVLSDFTLVDEREVLQSPDCKVIIRGLGRNPEGFARIALVSEELCITTQNPVWAPALGQPVVIYREDRVVGGGILERYF